MKRRIDDILLLIDGKLENHNISKEIYEIIKNDIHLFIQDEITFSSSQNVDLSKPFKCIEFCEGYAIFYHYYP